MKDRGEVTDQNSNKNTKTDLSGSSVSEYQNGFPIEDKYENPVNVLNDALSEIDIEGKVDYIEETGEHYHWPPHKSLNLEELPRDSFNHHLLLVARSLHGAIMTIRSFPEMRETAIKDFAVSLTPYRHNLKFLEKAASLVKVDEDGYLHDPILPNEVELPKDNQDSSTNEVSGYEAMDAYEKHVKKLYEEFYAIPNPTREQQDAILELSFELHRFDSDGWRYIKTLALAYQNIDL